MKAIGCKFVSCSLLAFAISGCATSSGLYQWGNYDTLLYQSYKSPEKIESMRLGLEAHVESMSLTKQRVAPGIFAELGTLYLQAGNTPKAIEMYSKERDAWPESKGLMDSLISNVGKRPAKRTGEKQ